jgi:hypothetical protein
MKFYLAKMDVFLMTEFVARLNFYLVCGSFYKFKMSFFAKGSKLELAFM